MNINVHTEIMDNSDEILEEFEEALLRALERCGEQAEGYAVDLCPEDTSNLKNSISHKVSESEKAAYVGTNSEYGPYVELGTGKHYPGGRQGWWVYVKGGSGQKSKNPGKVYTYEEAKRIVAMLRDDGLDAHMTCGQKPQPYLKPAVADHKDTYRNIIRDEMENA